MTSSRTNRDRGSSEGPYDAGDRLLEFALEELARERSQGGSRHSGPDLVALVRAAHTRGERGQDITDLAEGTSVRSDSTLGARPPQATRTEAGLQSSTQLKGPRRTLGPTPQSVPPGWRPLGWIPPEHRRIASAALILILASAFVWAFLWNGKDRNQAGPREGPDSPFVAAGDGSAGDNDPGNGQPISDAPDAPIADVGDRQSPIPVGPLASLLLAERPGFSIGPLEAIRTEQLQAEILDALGERPEAWPFLQAEVLASMDGRFVGPVPGKRLIALATLAPPSSGTELARALWLRIPQWFTTQDLVFFSGRNLFEFERELVSLALDRDPETLASNGGPDLLANAWLLNRGDSRGIKPLRDFLEQAPLDSAPKQNPEALQRGVMTVALAARMIQGAEGGDAWDRGHARITKVVLDFAEAGNFEAAGMALAVLEYMRLTPAPPGFPIESFRLEFLDYVDKVEWYSADRAVLVTRLEQCAPWGR